MQNLYIISSVTGAIRMMVVFIRKVFAKTSESIIDWLVLSILHKETPIPTMTSKKNVNKPTVKKREKLLLFKFFTASTQSAGNRKIAGMNTNVCAKNVRLFVIKVLPILGRKYPANTITNKYHKI